MDQRYEDRWSWWWKEGEIDCLMFFIFSFFDCFIWQKKEEEKQKDENADQVFDVFENELKIQKIKSSENEG